MAAAPAPPADREALRPLAWACAAFAGGVLLNCDRVPAWTPATALLLIAWRLTTERSGARLPGTVARALLALAVVAVVLWRFHTLNGLAAGTALLMLMSTLKLLETRARRDQLVMVGAGLFLLLAACLDRQSLARLPLYALQAWLCCSALAVVASAGFGARAALQLAGRALLLALPLAVALFLFFPRLSGAFWAIPRGGEALTGLSDSMSPGSIVKLAETRGVTLDKLSLAEMQSAEPAITQDVFKVLSPEASVASRMSLGGTATFAGSGGRAFLSGGTVTIASGGFISGADIHAGGSLVQSAATHPVTGATGSWMWTTS